MNRAHRRSRTARALLTVCAAVLLTVPRALAQQPQAAVVPEAITVGDVFRAAVRIELPPGATLVAPDSLPLPADLELAGRREIRIEEVDGARRAIVVYPLSAWRPGSYALAPIDLRILSDGGEASVPVRFPPFTVRSVLPADTAGIQPREAKDVLGANRLWWPILLALLLAAAVAGALWYWWRRRRKPALEEAPLPAAPPIHPRVAALARLEELRRSGLVERGEMKLFYERLTAALRHYVAALHPAWSVDLTTAELAPRMVSAGMPGAAVDLVRILGAADLVKFARRQAAPADAQGDLDAAVLWVERAEPAAAGSGTEDRRVA
jgi:hypothetical protein